MATRKIRTRGDYSSFLNDMNHRMKTMSELIKTSSVQEIYECLKDVLADSVPLAPIEEGALREAGHVAVNNVRYARGNVDGSISETASYDPTPDATQVDFAIGYTVEGGGTGREGDVNTYAVVQHEHVEFDHPRGGQAKFLEMPLREHRNTWKKRVADRIKNDLKGV
ncbi:MAG: hypothetical protein ACOX3H_06840 [Saccharofermentanales bacterium]|jgi:hypothetical protein